jgi:hypothetical protein
MDLKSLENFLVRTDLAPEKEPLSDVMFHHDGDELTEEDEFTRYYNEYSVQSVAETDDEPSGSWSSEEPETEPNHNYGWGSGDEEAPDLYGWGSSEKDSEDSVQESEDEHMSEVEPIDDWDTYSCESVEDLLDEGCGSADDQTSSKRPLFRVDDDYYQSSRGLWTSEWFEGAQRPAIRHLMSLPTEILANNRSFGWNEDRQLVGRGAIIQLEYKSPTWGLQPNKRERQAIYSEQVAHYFSERASARTEFSDECRLYYRNLEVLEFCRAIWDAYCVSLTQISDRHKTFRITSDMARAIDRLRKRVIRNPYQTAQELKLLAGQNRAWYFGCGPRPSGDLARFPVRKHALWFSYLGRALPALPSNHSTMGEGLLELRDRLCKGEVLEMHSDWPIFCEEYLQRYKPTSSAEPTRMDPSGHGSLGYPRKDGGLNRAMSDLAALGSFLLLEKTIDSYIAGLNPEEAANFDRSEAFERGSWARSAARAQNLQATKPRRWIPSEGATAVHRFKPKRAEPSTSAPIPPRTIEDLADRAIYMEGAPEALLAAVEWVMEQVDTVPTLGLVAAERGMKTRYPTLELAAANALHQMFRRVADSHLRKDPRCSHGIGGDIPCPDFMSWGGPFYSVDASYATDLHPHKAIEAFYLVLIRMHPHLARWERFLWKLVGPRRLLAVDRKEVPDCPSVHFLEEDVQAFTAPPDREEGVMSNTFREVKKGRRIGPSKRPQTLLTAVTRRGGGASKMAKYKEDFQKWLQAVMELPYDLTLRGGMMGSASSFPIMPMMTAFATWKEFFMARNAVFETAQASMRAAALKRRFVATGDDAVIPRCGAKRKERIDTAYSYMGVVISRGDPSKDKPRKDFLHDCRAIYKEEVFDLHSRNKDKKIPVLFTSLVVSPPGGSKPTLNWQTIGPGVTEALNTVGMSIKTNHWLRTPHRRLAAAAWKLGLPVSCPVGLGGVMYYGTSPYSCRWHWLWMDKLNSLKLGELVMGTGLSPIASSKATPIRTALRSWVDTIISDGTKLSAEQVENKEHSWRSPLVEDLVTDTGNLFSNWSLFFPVASTDVDRPRVVYSVSRFIGKLKNTKRYRGRRTSVKASYYNTLASLEKKACRYVVDLDFIKSIIALAPKRSYTIVQGSHAFKAADLKDLLAGRGTLVPGIEFNFAWKADFNNLTIVKSLRSFGYLGNKPNIRREAIRPSQDDDRD